MIVLAAIISVVMEIFLMKKKIFNVHTCGEVAIKKLTATLFWDRIIITVVHIADCLYNNLL